MFGQSLPEQIEVTIYICCCSAAWLQFYKGLFLRYMNKRLIWSSPVAKEHPQSEVQHQGLHEPPLPEKFQEVQCLATSTIK